MTPLFLTTAARTLSLNGEGDARKNKQVTFKNLTNQPFSIHGEGSERSGQDEEKMERVSLMRYPCGYCCPNQPYKPHRKKYDEHQDRILHSKDLVDKSKRK